MDEEFEGAARGLEALFGSTDWLDAAPSVMSRRIHGALFQEAWEDAAALRRVDTNIGVPWPQIPVALRDIDADYAVWGDDDLYVLTARLHYRFERIHPFRDGNGRTGRLLCDLLLLRQGLPNSSWGAMLVEGRTQYLSALRAAMGGDEGPLVRMIVG